MRNDQSDLKKNKLIQINMIISMIEIIRPVYEGNTSDIIKL